MVRTSRSPDGMNDNRGGVHAYRSATRSSPIWEFSAPTPSAQASILDRKPMLALQPDELAALAQ